MKLSIVVCIILLGFNQASKNNIDVVRSPLLGKSRNPPPKNTRVVTSAPIVFGNETNRWLDFTRTRITLEPDTYLAGLAWSKYSTLGLKLNSSNELLFIDKLKSQLKANIEKELAGAPSGSKFIVDKTGFKLVGEINATLPIYCPIDTKCVVHINQNVDNQFWHTWVSYNHIKNASTLIHGVAQHGKALRLEFFGPACKIAWFNELVYLAQGILEIPNKLFGIRLGDNAKVDLQYGIHISLPTGELVGGFGLRDTQSCSKFN